MVEVRTIADGFLNYTKATAISLNGIRLLCYLGILCRVALTDHSTRKIPGRYHIYILLIAAADMVLTGNSETGSVLKQNRRFFNGAGQQLHPLYMGVVI